MEESETFCQDNPRITYQYLTYQKCLNLIEPLVIINEVLKVHVVELYYVYKTAENQWKSESNDGADYCFFVVLVEGVKICL